MKAPALPAALLLALVLRLAFCAYVYPQRWGIDPAGYDADGVKKHLSSPEAKGHLQALRDAYAVIPEWTEVALEKRLRELAEARAAKAATLIHGARLAMTGRMVSPGLFEMLVLLGQTRVLTRMDRLIATLP